MLEMFNKARIRCPVVVYEEFLYAVVLERKRPKNDKKPITSQFLTLLRIFYQIFNRLHVLEC